ncbi:MAG TPA: NAD-dependent epimerase/dehydratase family protein [Candidatus Paceibacterota bacterium]
MNVLILGASTEKSIGYHIGAHLGRQGNTVVYASRSGALGYTCDVTDVAAVTKLFENERPDLVIHAAGGAFLNTAPLGACVDWSDMAQHIASKSFGTIVLLDAAVRIGTVKNFVMLGGRAAFGDEKMAAYVAGNGALWSLTQFANQHIASINSFYFDMPIVIGTTNAEGLIAAGAHTASEHAQAIYVERVVEAVDNIIIGKTPQGRVVL